jgi:fatty acid desaturase
MSMPQSVVAESRQRSDYAELSELIKSAGLLKRRRINYGVRILATVMFFFAAVAAVVVIGNSWYQLIVAAIFGVASTQVAFLGHDGGHQQVFRRRQANDLLSLLAGDLLVGFSYGWWLAKHNRHHANPNQEDSDPDIGDGVLVFTTAQAASRRGWLACAVLRRQAWLFFPLLTLEGLNLHIASIRSLLRGGVRSSRLPRSAEIILLGVHFAAYFTLIATQMSPWLALAFIAVHQAVFGFYMGCSFAPNHKGMPTIAAHIKLDMLRRQVLTSRNVRGGVWVDFLLGGLNYQIEHHLFPSMPRPNLRRAQRIVRGYCRSKDLSYAEVSLVGSYRAVLRHLNQLGEPCRSQA